MLVRVEAVGLCGTDLHVLDGEFAPTVFPIIPGHETSGVVEAVGDRSTEFAPGDRVSVDPTLDLRPLLLLHRGPGQPVRELERIRRRADRRLHGRADGRAGARTCTASPTGSTWQLAALIEPLSCAIRGYDLLPRRMGEHYLIYGAGTMGLMMAQLAPRAGAASVTVVDRNPARLDVAKEVGIAELGAVGRRGRATGRLGRGDRLHRGGGGDRGRARPGSAVAAPSSSSAWPPPTPPRRFSPFRVYNDELTIIGSMAVLNTYGRAVEMFTDRRARCADGWSVTPSPWPTTERRWRCSGPARDASCRYDPRLDESMELL